MCNDCIKADVCNQKDMLKKVETVCINLSISQGENTVYPISAIRNNYGITVKVECSKYSPSKDYDYYN
ncbi:MAG TPA: hypothetical protein DEF04_09780 [Clostridiales bacterium]|nr:hypothetical protein [Clostridiales bacterium]